MSLVLKEIRNPVPLVRARKVRAAIQLGGPLVELTAAGAIPVAPLESLAFLVIPDSAGMALTIANLAANEVGTVLNFYYYRQTNDLYTATLTLSCLAVYAEPKVLAATGDNIATFSTIDDYLTLRWDGTNYSVIDYGGVAFSQ